MKNECCQEMLGWRVVKTYNINIPASNVLELEHIETGARYVHIANDLKENVFVLGFKTVPTDSTGVAHILEHTVLTGSRDYPIRDPFFSMLKRSLQSFMNAFTSEDWTAYPFASPNKKDFFNLMKLYLDATFFPRLDKLNFLQEGWRYTLENNQLKYDGVVFNEMKGSMSSEDRCKADAVATSIYAEAPYHFNTGGLPEDIPNLSYDDLVSFHKKHYHPSNAFFFSYGNISLKEKLELFNEKVMKDFKRSNDLPQVKAESRWTKERETRLEYPSSDENAKAQVSLSWLTASVDDNMEVFSLEILEDILLGSVASPLRKALLESGLGEDLCDDTGYESEPVDTKFTIGLKGADEKDKEKIKKLILGTLESLVKNGLDKELIESVINNNELRKRHIQNQPYPYGLQLFLNIMAPWIHEGNVEEVLEFDALLRGLKKKISEGNYFESLIKKYFLENKHCLYLVLAPSMELRENQERQEAKRLSEKLESLDKKELQTIEEQSRHLVDLQQKQEDFSCLPSLELSDIDTKLKKLEPKREGNTYKYKTNSNGLLYSVGTYDLSSLDSSSKMYLPLYSYLLSKLDTEKHDYASLSKLIDKYTGGINTSQSAMKAYKDRDDMEIFLLQAYCLRANTDKLAELSNEVLRETKFDDIKRVKILLSSLYSKYQSGVVANGHIYASKLAMSSLYKSAKTTEEWQGISQLQFLAGLKEDPSKLQNNLEAIREYLKTSNEKLALIADDTDCDLFETNKKKEEFRDEEVFEGNMCKKAYATSSSVNFVAAATILPKIGEADTAQLLVLSKILARGYMHNEIREKRGAYGGFARYNHLDGSWWFGSYRDPHIVSTLEVIAGAKEHILGRDISKQEVEEAIISVSSDIDPPKTEVEEAKSSFYRTLTELKDEERLRFRENLLSVNADDIKRVAEKHLKDKWQDYSVAVVGDKKRLTEINKRLGEDSLEFVN